MKRPSKPAAWRRSSRIWMPSLRSMTNANWRARWVKPYGLTSTRLNNTNFHTPNLFGLWVAPGFGDVEHYTAYLMQGGLQLPDREYYLSDADAHARYPRQVSGSRCDDAQTGRLR